MHWSRLDTFVCDQHSGGIKVNLKHFHLFETVIAGNQALEADTNLERKSPKPFSLQAGGVQFQSGNVDAELFMDGDATYHQVLIDDSFFREAWQAMYPGDPSKFEMRSFYGIHDDAMRRCTIALLDEARMPTAGGELYAETLAQQIALLVLRRQDSIAQKLVPDLRLSDIELNRVVEHMNATLEDPGGLETMARLVDMDVYTFARAFKATTGVPPHAYLIELRMIAIKDQLANTNTPLAEVAYGAGFSSQSHMTTSFSKRMGVTPGKYRTMARR